MGNSESSNPIRNMDKRTARREYKDDFINAIQRYRKAYIQSHPTKNYSTKPSFSTWDDNSIRVFARKRPIFSHEIESDEYDVITCHQDTIIIHDARMHTDMKRQFINHHEFQFDYVFNEWETNQSVYEISTKPLVEIACEGGFSTALVYGQTGSGKTFTMSSMYSQAADEIFNFLHRKVERFSNSLPIITVSFIEIAGDHVHDLLNAFTPTQLRTAGDGSIHAFPVTEPRVTNKEELLAVVQHGLNIRTTAATGVHDASSRSHAILKIYIQRPDLRYKNGTNDAIEGTLTLVDLAGSEHRIDSMYHGKERRKETSHINASLMALKECIRAKAMGTSQSHQHVFRKSKLTMALKNSFNLPNARTIVIATVSPASKDTEHSLNTLRHACIMHGQENEEGGANGGDKETRFVTGGKITTEEIGEINIARIAKRNFEKKKSNNGSLDELKTNNGNQVESKLAKAANKEIEITDKMKRKMRRLSENKSFVTLDESIQRLLKDSRAQLGKEQRQFARLQVASGNNGNGNNNPDYEALQRIVEEEQVEKNIDERDSSDDEEVPDDVDQFHSSLPKKQQPLSKNSIDQDFAALYEDDFESFTPRSSSHHTDVKPSVAHKPVSGNSHRTKEYARVPFEKIYECIFIAKDSVPVSILLMQLRAMLKVHHYSTDEIEQFINKEFKRKESVSSGSTASRNNARPTTPRRPSTPQRPVSAGRSGSSSSITPANDRSRSNSNAHAQGNNKTPNRRLSNGSNHAHVKATIADSDNETYASSNNDNSSISRHNNRSQAGIGKMSAAEQEKEDKMLRAKQQLELEAQQRKQRQEAAKQFRQESEQQKVNQIITKTGVNSNNNNAKRQQMMLMLQKKSFEEENEKKIQKEIEQHQQEIHRLNQLIEIDRTAKTTDEKLSMAQKFGVKKQLALHKAAILKAERKKASLGESLRENLNFVSVGGGVSSGYNDEPSPSEMRRSLSRDSITGHQGSRGVIDFDEMVVPAQSRSAGGVNGGVAEKKSIRTEGSGSSGNGNGNNLRYYGASGGGDGVKKRPEWNFDVPSDSAFSSDSIVEHNTADSGKDSDDLPLISERGRPLSMRMAQQMAKRNPAAPQY